MNTITLIIINNIVLLIIIALIIVAIFVLRGKLFKLWHQVSRLELIFHKNLIETFHMYQKNSTLLESIPVYKSLQAFTPKNNKKFRQLKLADRQKLFKNLQKIYAEIYTLEDDTYKPLKKQFETLQECRLKYNSKVLLYNQRIHTFPLKIIAKRMNFFPKEYFG